LLLFLTPAVALSGERSKDFRDIESHVAGKLTRYIPFTLAFASDGKALALGGLDADARELRYGGDGQWIRLWDITGKGPARQLRQLSGKLSTAVLMEYHTRWNQLASAHFDNLGSFSQINLWDVKTRTKKNLFADNELIGTVITALKYSPQGEYLAAVIFDHKPNVNVTSSVRLWEPASGKLVAQFPFDELYVDCLAFSPDAKFLYLGCRDGTVRRWSVAQKKTCGVLTAHREGISFLAISRDGKEIISGSRAEKNGFEVRFWENASLTLRGVLTGNMDAFHGLISSPDTGHLVAVGNDGTIKVWQRIGRRLVATIRNGPKGVLAMAFSRDGRILALACQDEVVLVNFSSLVAKK
jgi:WD40 repeat protein